MGHNHNTSRDRVQRFTLFCLGACLISTAVVCGYLLGWTNHQSRQIAQTETEAIERMWDTPTPHLENSRISGKTSSIKFGQPEILTNPSVKSENRYSSLGIQQTKRGGFALLYIPRIRQDVWGTPILQGVGRRQINAGIGHYPHSAMPGHKGTFTLVGHRATYGAWFSHIDELRNGDSVIVRIHHRWFRYVLYHHAVVSPQSTWVLRAPTRFHHKIFSPKPMITLITCNPRWGSSERWIWWGKLIEQNNSARYPYHH